MIYDSYPAVTPEVVAAVKAGTDCPLCTPPGWKWGPYGKISVRCEPHRYMNQGRLITDVEVDCPCVKLRRLQRKVKETIPPHYQHMTLKTAAPSPLARNAKPEFQQQVIDHVRATWGQSQFFIGPPGTGKTALEYALWRQWLRYIILNFEDWAWPLWNVDANELMDQHHAWVTRREGSDMEKPEIRAPMIKYLANKYPAEKKFKPVLFLRELDKFNATEFKTNTLFSILDALHNYDGVLVLDSNLNWEQFRAKFGDPLCRRIAVMCHRVDYHNQTITPPSEDPQ